jgi:nucleoid DNA-binding protein
MPASRTKTAADVPKPARKRATKAVAKPAEADAAEAPEAAPVLKLRDLVERCASRSGAKKPAAKPVIEAALAVIAEALDAGQSLNLPPLGRVRVARANDGPGGAMLTLKLKRAGSARKGEAPLAEGGEAG